MPKPKLVMMCGTSGSGKTYFSKLLESRGFARLSIDEELWPDFYVLSDMLTPEHKAFLKEQGMERLRSRAANFVADGKNVVIDMCFCHKAQRDEFRTFGESLGAEPVLIYIKASLPVLRARLADRAGKNGPNSLPVSEEELLRFWSGFQPPEGEGEIVIDSEKPIDIDEILKNI
ncbi:MAG: AAA family ATPase [Oscillospiraceae bacterium]